MAIVIFAGLLDRALACADAGKVDYETYRKAAPRFPEIPREQFQRSVVYMNNEGEVFFAAEAVYRSLSCRSSRKWMAWSYDHVPGFAAISEIAYKIIARHRTFGSAVTRLLWGADVRPPTYFAARRWFLRALGLVYLIAFVSFWVQVDGLVGVNGILPLSQFLSAAYEQLGGGLIRSCRRFAGSIRATPFSISCAVAALFCRCF